MFPYVRHRADYIGLDGNPDFVQSNILLKGAERHFLQVDLRQPVRLSNWEGPVKADLICSFEVLEHIPEEYAGTVIDSIRAHAHPRTRVYLTVSLKHRLMDDGHVTVKSRPWWTAKFKSHGFVPCDDSHDMIGQMFTNHPFNWRPFSTHAFYLRPE